MPSSFTHFSSTNVGALRLHEWLRSLQYHKRRWSALPLILCYCNFAFAVFWLTNEYVEDFFFKNLKHKAWEYSHDTWLHCWHIKMVFSSAFCFLWPQCEQSWLLLWLFAFKTVTHFLKGDQRHHHLIALTPPCCLKYQWPWSISQLS